MLAHRLNQRARSSLFVLAPGTDEPGPSSHTASDVRLRLRKWEVRRTWAARALIALSFPLAYVLFMFTTGQDAPVAAARVVIRVWLAALAVAILCAEAVWRHRYRLERIFGERPPGSRA